MKPIEEMAREVVTQARNQNEGVCAELVAEALREVRDEVERLRKGPCNQCLGIQLESAHLETDVELLRQQLAALWHFATCDFDHCERCIRDEALIKQIRDEQAKLDGK